MSENIDKPLSFDNLSVLNHMLRTNKITVGEFFSLLERYIAIKARADEKV